MNIPTYQKKDYSFLPNAFSNLAQGAGQFQQSISRSQDIEEKERKRIQDEEYLAKVKLSRQEMEALYENTVANAAVELHEAMGLPPDEEGFDRAMTEAVKIFHPITPDEWKTGTGAKRLHQQEQDKLPKILGNFKMKNWDKLYLQGGDQKRFATGMQRPTGEVGVETEPGKIQKPTGTLPQTLEDVQRPAEQDSLSPTLQTTLPDEMTPEQWYKIGVELDITDNPKFIERMKYLQRKYTMSEYGGKPTVQQYSTSALGMPIVEDEKSLVKGLPSEISAKDKIKLATDRLKALRKADTQDEKDDNILKLMKEKNDLAQDVIKNGATISRLRQVLVKIKDRRALNAEERGLIQSVVTNVDDPSTYQIESRINVLETENEALKGIQQDIDNIVFDMSGGFSLSEAIKNIEKRKQATYNKAKKWIDNNLDRFGPQVQSTSQLLNRLPEEYKKAVEEKIIWARDRGALDKDMVKRILGRQ